jgi:hypothetical protein
MHLDKLINSVYSFGAAVVVFGAWGKLEHKEFGSLALTIGLLTETSIFCLYGFLEWRKRPPFHSSQEAPPTIHTTASSSTIPSDTIDKLADTVAQTNQILNKVFKAN